MKVVKVTSKGQVTIAVEVEETYLEVSEAGDEIRLRKVARAHPLSDDDPIWKLVAAGESGYSDVAAEHDRHAVDAEIERWGEPS